VADQLRLWRLHIDAGHGARSAFTGALHIALAMSIVFALDPGRRSMAILAGLSIGVAIWGRGNSITVVALVVFCPCISVVMSALRHKNTTIWINVAVGP